MAEPSLQQMSEQLQRLERQLLKTRKGLATLQVETLLRAQDREPVFPVEFTSQHGEDLLAWTLFEGQTAGYFVEVGAFNGYHHSVTYPFEAIGWRGLLVEPTPARASQSTAARPNSRVLNVALSKRGSSGMIQHSIVQDQFGGALSYTHRTLAQLQKVRDLPWSTVSVPVTTLDELLKDHRDAIDLCVIDASGAELDVLDGFDLERFRPRVLIIDHESHGPALVAHFESRPYTRIGELASSDVYVRDDQSTLLERFRWSEQ